jgi:hypothetical protein
MRNQNHYSVSINVSGKNVRVKVPYYSLPGSWRAQYEQYSVVGKNVFYDSGINSVSMRYDRVFEVLNDPKNGLLTVKELIAKVKASSGRVKATSEDLARYEELKHKLVLLAHKEHARKLKADAAKIVRDVAHAKAQIIRAQKVLAKYELTTVNKV